MGLNIYKIYNKKVKLSCYRPNVAQRVDRGIALLFHDRSTRRGWVVSSTLWLYFAPGRDLVPFVQEAGWAPELVWTGGKSRPHRNSIPDRPAHSQLLYKIYNKWTKSLFQQFILKKHRQIMGSFVVVFLFLQKQFQ